MDAIKDKTSESYKDIAVNFSKKIKIQEEIFSLELIREKLNWMVGERISLLEGELAQLAANEVSNSEILDMELNMDIDELLEITLCEMRNHTKLFEKFRNKQLKETKIDPEQKLLDHQSRVCLLYTSPSPRD